MAQLCECVAQISRCEVGMPVAREAMALADSQMSRGIMHASTMQKTRVVEPLCSAKLRACMGSVTVREKAPFMPPLMGEGS